MAARRARSVLCLMLGSVIVVLAGCAAETPPSAAAPAVDAPVVGAVAELTGPWRAKPLGLDPVMRRAIEAACGRDMEVRGTPAVFMDVRGEGVAIVRLSGARSAGCDAMHIQADGSVIGAGGGWSQDGPERLAAIGADAFADIQRSRVEGGNLTATGSSVLGRAGAGIASVVIEPLGQPQVVASLQNGWFGAWWPAPAGAFAGGGEGPPIIIRGYDLLGTLISEVEG
jgi:hypothetical protein